MALFILGAWNGTLDVSMNAHAIAVERRYGRPIMSSFHALFSLGGLAGAAIAGLAIAAGVGRVTHVLIASGIAVAIIASVVRWLLPTEPVISQHAVRCDSRDDNAVTFVAWLGCRKSLTRKGCAVVEGGREYSFRGV